MEKDKALMIAVMLAVGLALIATAIGLTSRPVYSVVAGLTGIVLTTVSLKMCQPLITETKKPQAP